MSDEPTPTPTPDPSPTPPPAAPATPWYQGKADAETVGFLQNNGWDKDPTDAALNAVKSYREAQRFLGAPPNQLVRLPQNPQDEAGWKTFRTKLGIPTEPTGYDFSDVKFADGSPMDASTADMIRKTAFDNNVPKDAAAAFARALVQQAETADKTESEAAQSQWNAAMARLEQSWGPKDSATWRQNELMALEGAARVGIDQETYDKMAKTVGPDVVVEMFRKIGAGTKEDTWREGNQKAPTTVEMAKARKAELMADKDWTKRYMAGGVAEQREMKNLQQIITGVTDTRAA